MIKLLLMVFMVLLLFAGYIFIEELRKVLFGLFLVSLLLLGYTFVEPYWLTVTTIPFESPDLPASFDGTRIVFAADIHHGPFFARWRVEKLVETIDRLRPDIAVFGGDYIYLDPKYITPCFEALREVKAPFGKFGVLGNHDHWKDAELTKQQMERAGITILDNQAMWIVQDRERIKIGGVGDLWEDTKILDQLSRKRKKMILSFSFLIILIMPSCLKRIRSI